MGKFWALLGSAVFFVIAPGTLAGYVPWALTGWHAQAPFLGQEWTRGAGAALAGAGLIALIDSFLRFALQGKGTPAPIAPPTRLVVTGQFRFVRNPMYVAVMAMILGQALALASVALVEYGAVLWLSFHLFVLGYEEPTLRSSFSADYPRYCRHVRRWLPRLTPWKDPAG